MTPPTWPRLTSAIPGFRARLKERLEDFRVEELLDFEPAGEGDHLFVRIEKRGLGTPQAAAILARRLGKSPRRAGFAGRKDKHAVTTQTFSFEHVAPARLEGLQGWRSGGLRVLAAAHHPRKLHAGELRGNRFTIRLRLGSDDPAGAPGEDASPPEALERARASLALLEERGLPNYFGPQRFGSRGDNWQVGRDLCQGRWEEAAAGMAGSPSEADHGPVLAAREAFARGDWDTAARTFPRGYEEASRLARAMGTHAGDARAALGELDKHTRRFYRSAYQSWIFNHVLAERIETCDRLLEGDLALEHADSGLLRVDEPAALAPRAAAFELSPTGPLPGWRSPQPSGAALALEERVLAACDVTRETFARRDAESLRGSRRPLRLRPEDPHLEPVEDNGPCLDLTFTLPPGAFATSLVDELTQ